MLDRRSFIDPYCGIDDAPRSHDLRNEHSSITLSTTDFCLAFFNSSFPQSTLYIKHVLKYLVG